MTLTPTKYGYVFLAAAGGMIFGALNYRNNPGLLFALLLIAMALISVRSTWKNIRDVDIHFLTAEPVFAGDEAAFTFNLSASSDCKAVTVAFDSEPGVSVDVRKNAARKIGVPLPAKRRGILRPQSLTVTSVYPFGVFRVKRRVRVDAECVVYPKPIFGPLVFGMAAGRGDSRISDDNIGGSEDFAGLKSYQPGDSISRISWKAYSRNQRLYIKAFAGTTGGAAVIDWNRIPAEDVEYRLSLMCGMILKSEAEHLTYGMRLPGAIIEEGRGPVHRSRCLKQLALVV